MNQIQVTACRFKRSESEPYERGVMLGHGDVIVGQDKKVVKKVWTYDETPEEGCFKFTPLPPRSPKPEPKTPTLIPFR